METDQRLTLLPRTIDLGVNPGEYPAAYSSFYEESLPNKRTIRQYMNVVYKRAPVILAIMILMTAAVSIYSFRQPSLYEATTTIIIEPRKPQVTQKDAININLRSDTNYYNTQLLLLRRPDLMKNVVISLGLHREPNLFGHEGRGIAASIRSMFAGPPKSSGPQNSLPVLTETSPDKFISEKQQLTPEEQNLATKYAETLADGLKVEQTKDTNFVSISVESSNPTLAAKVSDRVAELFKERDSERETAGAQKAYDDLKTSIEDLKATITKQENDYIEEMRLSDLPLQEKGGDLRASNLEGLLTQKRDAQNETGKIQALYSAAISGSGKGDILSVVGDNKGIQDARSQNLKRQADLEKRIEDIDKKINEAKENKERLLTKYTDEHRAVVEVNAQIKELETQKTRINQEVSEKIKLQGTKLEKNAEKEVLASLRSQLSAARQREERQRTVYEQAASKANVEGRAETKLTGLKREIESNRSLLDTYTQRQKEQELALSTQRPNNIKINNQADIPTEPTGPQRIRNIVIAFLLSFAAGVGLAFLMDYLDDSVRTSDDVSRHLGLATLAFIPLYADTDKRKLLVSPKNGNGSVSPAAFITLEDRHSSIAEAYRHLRTALLFSSAGKPPQTILVTSAQPSEGKTTTAINTAVTLAQADADVVIVDCDLRRPCLHRYFDLENSQGLTNYLSGERNTEHLIKNCKDLPRLKVITSGPIPPNPAELLSSNEMKELLQFLRERYKHVIIDSPPAISFTDAAILSTLVDGVVLVTMPGKSSIHLMRRFTQRLGNIGARIYGVVLNGIKSGSMEYDYYGSGYYDYYGKDVDDVVLDVEKTESSHTTKA